MNSRPPKPFSFDVTDVRVQDIVVVAAFLVATFVFRVPDSYDLKPTWRLDIEPPSKQEKNLL